MPSKYKAKRVTDERYGLFDSQREYRRFLQLKRMEEDGEIEGLERQFKFILIPKTPLPYPYREKNGRMKNCEKEVSYIADFVYKRGTRTIVEDSKGFRTESYILKRKLMLFVYGIQIEEV